MRDRSSSLRATIEVVDLARDVDAESLAAEMNWPYLAVQLAEISSYHKTPSDTVPLSDVMTVALTKPRADRIDTDDAFIVTLVKARADASEVQDFLTRQITKDRSEELQITEGPAKLFTKPRTDEHTTSDTLSIERAGGSVLDRLALDEFTLG